MRRTLIAGLLAGLTLLPAAWGLNEDFNWVPSGAIVIGDRASEAAAGYEAESTLVELPGVTPAPLMARRVRGPELFVLRPASWRLGSAWADLVLCRTVDLREGAPALTVRVGDQELVPWAAIPSSLDADGPVLNEAVYVIPRTTFPKGEPPAELRVTLTPPSDAQPHLAIRYRFYATRDWEVLGGDLAGDISRLVWGDPNGLDPAKYAYLLGVVGTGCRNWQSAREAFKRVAEAAAPGTDAALARLGRHGVRRMNLKIARATAAENTDPKGAFDRHYHLGVLAGAWGCWEDARDEFKLAVQANPTDADATYRLAEAMEYCRMPLAEWAPLMERAGFLGEAAYARGRVPQQCNVEDVLVAIYTGGIPDFCQPITADEIAMLQEQWRYVEQMVYGASLGAWRLRTTWLVAGPEDPAWKMQAGWIFLPPDDVVPYEGRFAYSIGTAGYGSSHSGGMDCGVRGAGGAQIGPTRGWEVWLHEWNHQFDWTFLFAESHPAYPVTHDSDGCGKQPIVSMGCGHRGSMRYYIDRYQFYRHRAADPVNSAACIKSWAVTPVVPAPQPDDMSAAGLAKWLVAQGRLSEERLGQIKGDWERARQADEAARSKPPTVPAEPPPAPVPDWAGYLHDYWNHTRLLDELKLPEEAAILGGTNVTQPLHWKKVEATGDFVDLGTALPDAPEKGVVYARTFVASPHDQEARLWLGYNDCAALWVNGRPVTTGRYYAMAKWADANRPYMLAVPVQLKAGWNRIVLKVERGGGGWGFGVHLVDWQNQALDCLNVTPIPPQNEPVAQYTPPAVGEHYRWADVQDDYLERLPRLTDADLQRLTGIAGLTCDAQRFWLKLPEGVSPAAASHVLYVTAASDVMARDALQRADRQLNNYLNWDLEAAAALRYVKDGEARDLLLIRPEYYTEFLTLLREADTPLSRATAPNERLLGYLYLPEVTYSSTSNRPFTHRVVLVVETALPDYPEDDLDLLGPR